MGGGETFLVLAARGDGGRGRGGEEGNYNKGEGGFENWNKKML